MSAEPPAIREDRGAVAILTFNRPGKLNAINLEMREMLAAAVQDLRDDPALRMLLIRARGRYFSAGVDLSEPTPAAGLAAGYTPADLRRAYRLQYHTLPDEIEAIEKPVLVAIHAPCLGFGVELAGSCDFRVAAASATFRLPEVGLGVIAGSGGVSRFTRLCGVGWSKWLNVAGETIDAQTALAAGFVQAVWPDDEFEAEVWALCQRIVSRPADAQQAAKLAVDLSNDMDRQGARHMERIVNTPLMMQVETARLAGKAGDGMA